MKVMRPVFRVSPSDGWISCIPKNEAARMLIKGKLGALWPGPRVAEPYISFEEFIKKSKLVTIKKQR